MEQNGKTNFDIESSKIVVRYANIQCDKGSIKDRRLYLNSCHGVISGMRSCAHEKDCLPFENIPDFGICMSESYVKTLRNLLFYVDKTEGPKSAEHERLFNLLHTAIDTATHRCFLPLINNWFGTDSKNVIGNYFKLTNSIQNEISNLTQSIKLIMDSSREQFIDGQFIILRNDDKTFSSYETTKDNEKFKLFVKEIDDMHIENFSNLIFEQILYLLENPDNISDVKANIVLLQNRLTILSKKIKDITEIADKYANRRTDTEFTVKSAYDYYTIRSDFIIELNKISNLVDSIDKKIKIMLEKGFEETKFITTDSFLMCKCGGFINFVTSGQPEQNMLEKKTLELKNKLILIFKQILEDLKTKYIKFIKYEPESSFYQYCISMVKALLLYLQPDKVKEKELKKGLKGKIYVTFIVRNELIKIDKFKNDYATLFSMFPIPAAAIFGGGMSLKLSSEKDGEDSLFDIISEIFTGGSIVAAVKDISKLKNIAASWALDLMSRMSVILGVISILTPAELLPPDQNIVEGISVIIYSPTVKTKYNSKVDGCLFYITPYDNIQVKYDSSMGIGVDTDLQLVIDYKDVETFRKEYNGKKVIIENIK